MPARTPPTPQEVEAALREVYARPELNPPPPPLGGWLSRAWEWVEGVWDRLFPDAALSDTAGSALFWTLFAVLALLGLAIAVHLLLQAGGAWSRRTGERRDGEAAGGLVSPRGLHAADWEALARRAAGEGRWRDASLALYQALLFRLHDRGALRYDPSKTPGDYRRELRRAGGAAQPFERFVRLFEPVAFGGRGVDGDGYARLRALAEEGGARG